MSLLHAEHYKKKKKMPRHTMAVFSFTLRVNCLVYSVLFL